ncbi:hypothetical protein POJ06DRAFT_296511 [Lipomyces tetrasporus]|uniref:Uncharacterized protein n=1 Tax=Lipomyces tetrasporus TaxID=54092 RepID=A0AAD7QNK6_9ASCO|nr:uncharacterized protein POJ06DRAFT_296511 [Lipomyces tetrasporus]KAJ8098697.1 hypothetical protein POJ06DRAFT_296511 [Lipomyces tetrasporus]
MSTAPTSATIPIEEFRTKLREAVEARGERYQSIKMLSNCMKDVFGIDDVEDFAIEKTSKIPGLDVHELIMAKVKQLVHARSLLIIAYMGHGIIDIESKSLQLISENGSQRMLWSMIHDVILASTDDSIQNLDVLAVLDCCYAGSAVRAGGKRSVQLLASCDERRTVRSRKDGVTFTQRIRNAAFALKNAGNLSVSVESLFGELQRSKPRKAADAAHKIIGNARPLVLALKLPSSSPPGQAVSSSSPGEVESSSNETNVLFKISLSGGPTDMILGEFLQLVKRISLEFKVTVEDAVESNSVVILCRASWEAFVRLRSTLDCAFVASVKGPSLLRDEVGEKSGRTRSFGDRLDNGVG